MNNQENTANNNTEKKIVVLVNQNTHDRREVKNGYNPYFFVFGFFVPLFQKQWALAAISFAAQIFVAYFLGFGHIGSFILTGIAAIFYNRIYVKQLLKNGYHTTNEEDAKIVRNMTNF